MMPRKLAAALVVGGTLVAVAPAMAAGNSVTLAVSGTVALACSISAGNTSVSVTNALAVTGPTSVPVSGYTDTCNAKNGYTVTFTSQNGAAASATNGVLKGAISGNTDTATYTITSYGTANPLAMVNGKTTVTFGKTPGAGTARTLTLAVSGSPDLTADTYSDTLTIALANN
jgi:hypothetical protein